MTQHLHREIEKVKKRILELGAMVEESVRNAVRSVTTPDPALAQRVIDGDEAIDQLEVDIEEDCLQILALYQPVASDLRFLIAVLKLNSDLERIGDLASNLAVGAIKLERQGPFELPFDFEGMAERVQSMLRRSLDALVNLDPDLAREVCASDNEVDDMHRGVYKKVEVQIVAHPEKIETMIQTLALSRILERMADHTTNIAEDVIYTVEGRIYRHQLGAE